MKRIPVLALLLLGGCYATAEPLYLPDGSSGYRISCGDYIGTPADCIEEAGETCGTNGYQMYDQAGRLLSAEAQDRAVIAALNSDATRHDKSADTLQNMFIKCKTNEMPPHLIPAPIPPQVEAAPVPPAPPISSPPMAPAAPTPANNGPIPLR